MPLGSHRSPPPREKGLTAAQRAEGLAFARRWRIENKPYFDAIYGPEQTLGRCPSCGAPMLVPA